MKNRLLSLPKTVQKRVYEMWGGAGTICHNIPRDTDSKEFKDYDRAMVAFAYATDDEMKEFLEYARNNPEEKISWHDSLQATYRTNKQTKNYQSYTHSKEWKRKRDMVMCMAEKPTTVRKVTWRKGTVWGGKVMDVKLETTWKAVCQKDGCSNDATQVHHLTYDRIGKEDIMEDLQAICGTCHKNEHRSRRR